MSVLLDRARRGSLPSRERLLAAVAALFAFDGAVFGSWAARIPDVTTQVGTSHTGLGVALLCVSIGALASMQLAGARCTRLGAGRVAVVSAVLICVAVTLPGLARSLPELAVALLAFGAATGAVNVAANSAGVRIEAAGNRPIMPGLHAAFSFGGLVGAALGGLASGLGPVAPHLLVVAGVGLLLTAVIAPVLVGGDVEQRAADSGGVERADALADRPEPKRATTAPRRLLVVLGLIAGCTAYGEGAITDWGALHLRETLAATPAVAAAGYAAFSLAMACGRLVGGRLVRSFGATHVLVYGSVLAATGMLAAAFAPAVAVALVGFALVGLGLANVFPLAIARAGSLGGSKGVATGVDGRLHRPARRPAPDRAARRRGGPAGRAGDGVAARGGRRGPEPVRHAAAGAAARPGRGRARRRPRPRRRRPHPGGGPLRSRGAPLGRRPRPARPHRPRAPPAP